MTVMTVTLSVMTDATDRKWEIDPQGLTVQQIAERCGYGDSAVRGWSTQYNIPFVRDGKRNLYMEDGQRRFQQILEWKSQGITESEIAERFATNSPSQPEAPAINLESLIAESVSKAVEKQTALAESYAKATHHIGRLEERVENTQKLLEEKEAQLRLLPGQVQELEVERATIANQLSDATVALEKSKQEWDSERSKLIQDITVATQKENAATVAIDSLKRDLQAEQERKFDTQSKLKLVEESKNQEITRLTAELEKVLKESQFMREENEKLVEENKRLERELEIECKKGILDKLFKK